MIDEVERVGAYAERYEPARVTAVVVPMMLLVVVFPLSWPVGVLLILCLPLPPLNLSIVGMGTATVARQHGEELRYLSGYFLDRLRGLPTLRALGAEAGELGRIRAASQRLSTASMAVLRVAFLSAAVLEAIVTLSIAVVAIYVGLTLLGYVHVPGLAVTPFARHRAVRAHGDAAVLPTDAGTGHRVPRASRRPRGNRGAGAAPGR